jgi:hypothetical protein
MTIDLLEALKHSMRSARDELAEHVKPRDETERAIVNALGECSWDECVSAIQRYRTEQVPTPGDAR